MLGYDRPRFGEIDHLTPLGHLACYVVETSIQPHASYSRDSALGVTRRLLTRRERYGDAGNGLARGGLLEPWRR